MFTKSFDATFWGDNFPEPGISAVEDHNKMLRKLAPKERFLGHDVKQG
jgi:hypothetical protein